MRCSRWAESLRAAPPPRGERGGRVHQREGNHTQFVLEYQNTSMKVIYTGTDPLPDTLKDGAQALADGRLDRDQIFRAGTVQAKCASKYESKPGLAPGQAAPNINAGKSSI